MQAIEHEIEVTVRVHEVRSEYERQMEEYVLVLYLSSWHDSKIMFLLNFLLSIIQESKNGEGSCKAKGRKRVAQECQDKVSGDFA